MLKHNIPFTIFLQLHLGLLVIKLKGMVQCMKTF
jgi:hypothetical protein